MVYSPWIQFKHKVFQGDLKALAAIIWGMFDLIWSIPIIIKNSNRLSQKEFDIYMKLPQTKVYWPAKK